MVLLAWWGLLAGVLWVREHSHECLKPGSSQQHRSAATIDLGVSVLADHSVFTLPITLTAWSTSYCTPYNLAVRLKVVDEEKPEAFRDDCDVAGMRLCLPCVLMDPVRLRHVMQADRTQLSLTPFNSL